MCAAADRKTLFAEVKRASLVFRDASLKDEARGERVSQVGRASRIQQGRHVTLSKK